jgi:hypothetical protein
MVCGHFQGRSPGACTIAEWSMCLRRPSFIGDIDRFFVRIIASDPNFSSWSCGYVCCLAVNERDTIAEVKAKLQVKEGIPPEKVRLIFRGQKLELVRDLRSYGITDSDGQDWLIFAVMVPETLPLPTPTVP